MTDTTPKAKESPAKPAPKKVVDWEGVEMLYRAGIRSLKDIGKDFGVSDAGILKRAKRDGWTRDLKAKIQAKAEAKVSASLVSAEVSARTKVREHQIVEANAEAVATVRLAHRKDIQRARALSMTMLSQLEGQMGAELMDRLREVSEQLDNCDVDDVSIVDDAKDKIADIYELIKRLPLNVKTLKDLSDTIKTLVALERQAFGMDDKDNSPVDALTSLLHGIAQGNGASILPIALDPEHAKDED